jgi:hypothetical protein
MFHVAIGFGEAWSDGADGLNSDNYLQFTIFGWLASFWSWVPWSLSRLGFGVDGVPHGELSRGERDMYVLAFRM